MFCYFGGRNQRFLGLVCGVDVGRFEQDPMQALVLHFRSAKGFGPHTSDYRLCVKHLYGNWRKKYPGEVMKAALWAAARACIMPQWEKAMEHLKGLNEEAWKDMKELAPKVWTRAAFSTYPMCHLQVNNMCEAFNKAILELREKPIITLIDGLKTYMSTRIVKQRDLMLRYKGNICPMIQAKLETNKKHADGWSPQWSGDREYSQFEVSNGTDKYVVKLNEKTCSCRRWDLTGIPCSHAISCMFFNNKNPEEYVNYWYSKESFFKTYDHIILPSNSPQLWPVSLYPPINPPFMRRAPGRPKKARRKTNDEPKNPYRMRRNQNTIRCTRCGYSGHNVRTCSGKTTADRVIPTGGNKDYPQVLHPEQGVSGSTQDVNVGADRGRGGRGRGGRGRCGRGGAVGSQIEGKARKKQKVVQGTQESKNA